MHTTRMQWTQVGGSEVNGGRGKSQGSGSEVNSTRFTVTTGQSTNVVNAH